MIRPFVIGEVLAGPGARVVVTPAVCEILNRPVQTLAIGPRGWKACWVLNAYTVGELALLREMDIGGVRNCGEATREMMRRELRKLGLCLGMQRDEAVANGEADALAMAHRIADDAVVVAVGWKARYERAMRDLEAMRVELETLRGAPC